MDIHISDEYIDNVCCLCNKKLRTHKIKQREGELDELVIKDAHTKCHSLHIRKMKINQRLTNVEWEIYIRNHC
jgi:hypothetical protein